MAFNDAIRILCRDLQQDQLLSIFGKTNHLTVPSIFIFGHTATGKTLTLNMLLTSQQVPHVVVNCVETYTDRILYETILSGLMKSDADASPQPSFIEKLICMNANDFVRHLKEVAVARKFDSRTAYIVLDKAERLRGMNMNVLPVLLRLQELAACNVTTILVSEVAWEKFRSSPTGLFEPLVVHFPDYTKDELQQIMEADHPAEFPLEFYANYVRLIISVFYTVTRSLQELRYMAAINFNKFTEPIRKGEADVSNVRLLWKNIEPHLRAAMRTVYLREVSSKQWEELQQHDASSRHGVSSLESIGTPAAASIELPFFSKYLLVAAYLASYNPTKSDVTFFVKNSTKKKKSKTLARNQRTSSQLLGPKPFPLDRLLAIFYSIVESNVLPTASLYCQISSLVSLHLLSQVSSSQLDVPKYKCLVNLDFIKRISRTIQFDILKYLYDFV